MLKVLILAYEFPPYVSVAGLRPYNWYKYFHEFGIYPIVVTRQWQNKYQNHLDYVEKGYSNQLIVENTEKGTIIRTPYFPNFANKLLLKYGNSKYVLFRKLISAYYEFLQFICIVGPKAQLYKGGKKYLQDNKVDIIIATGDPFVLFFYANKLSKQFKIPWIADYRDPWSQQPAYQNNKILRWWMARQEKKIIQHPVNITTVSEFVASYINQFNIKKKPINIITNGYDPEAVEAAKGVEQNTETLNIGYAGTIYDWNPYEIFLKTIANLLQHNPQLKIHINFYGINKEQEINTLLNQQLQNLKPFVTIFPKIPNQELLKTLATNNLLLLFNYYSFMGTKIFDYLALKRQILLCFTNDPEAELLKNKYYKINESNNPNKQLQKELIEQTNAGYVIENQVHLQTTLLNIYQEFLANKKIECKSVGVENYSRKIQVEKLAKIIKDLCYQR